MTRGFVRQVGILWDAASVSTGNASAQVYLGRDPNVAVFIKNASTTSVTFKVECAGDIKNGPGLNNAVDWFPYINADDALGQAEVTVAAGANAALDFHTFTPSRIRLVATHAGAGSVGPITAFTEHYGG